MKFLTLFVFCFLSFSSCGKNYESTDSESNSYKKAEKLKCVPMEVNEYLFRCENEEVVCYFSIEKNGYVPGGVFCKFKTEEN